MSGRVPISVSGRTLSGVSGWTSTAVWEQLVEGAETLQRLPDASRGPRKVRSSWPEIVRNAAESFNAEAERADLRRLGPPSADAIDRLDRVIVWLEWLSGDVQRLVWLRACGVPWWRLELRPWLLRAARRRYDRATLSVHLRRALDAIAARQADLDHAGRPETIAFPLSAQPMHGTRSE